MKPLLTTFLEYHPRKIQENFIYEKRRQREKLGNE